MTLPVFIANRTFAYRTGMWPSGPWKNAVNDFGFVGDGLTDNAAAWNLFNEWARDETLAQRTARVLFPPTPGSKYVHDASLCRGFLLGIRDLVFYAPGAIFQNIYNGATTALKDAHWPTHSTVNLFGSGDFDRLIETTVIGSRTFTYVDPVAAAIAKPLAVGDHVLIGSRNDQFGGYPPNIGLYEFKRVVRLFSDGSGGQVNTPFEKVHRDDHPDGGAGTNPCGKARIWQLNSADEGSHGSETSGWSYRWDINHIMYGGEILPSANADDPTQYINVIGKRVVYIDFIRPGIANMTNQTFIQDGGKILANSEIDKINGDIIIRNGETEGDMFQQSEGCGDILIEDETMAEWSPGTARTAIGRRLTVAAYSEGVGSWRQGRSHGILVEDSSLVLTETFASDGLGTELLSLSDPAVGVSYDAGLGALIVNGAASGPAYTNTQIGQQIYWVTSTNCKLEENMMRVSDHPYEDGSGNRVIPVSPAIAPPAWATHLTTVRRYAADYINCTGSSRALAMSLAYTRGLKPWEFTRDVLGPTSVKNASFALGFGRLNEIKVDAPIARGAGGTLTIAFASCTLADFSDGKAFQIVIDMATSGERTFGLSGTVMLGTDAMTLGGSPITELPAKATRIMNSRPTFNHSYTPTVGDPEIAIEMTWDRGTVRTLLA